MIKRVPPSQVLHLEITRLPRLSVWRRAVRGVLLFILRVAVWLCTRSRRFGFENIPAHGPALVVTNHLGDVDLVIGMVLSPVSVEALAKADLYNFPIIGRLMDVYGVIWVHRGQPDRRAMRAALDGLGEGRFVAIAPEGRESITGALEEGTAGAAYLAIKAGVPVIPVTFTGTENARIYGNLKKLRRTDVTMTVGKPFYLEVLPDRKEAVERGTYQIMCTLATQLPEQYRGVYREVDCSEQKTATGETPHGY
jgi:1-acyl-sn-glycerol-3-phosphate acyltransferase